MMMMVIIRKISCYCLLICALTILGESRELDPCIAQCRASSNNKHQPQFHQHQYYVKILRNEPDFTKPVTLTSRLGVEKIKCEHGICDDTHNYPPEDEINQAVRENKALKSYFGTVVQQNDEIIKNRFDDNGSSNNMCDSERFTRMPKLMKNIDGKEMLIVNTDDFQQRINYEHCRNQNEPCWCERCHYPEKYFTKCVQQYLQIRLIVYKENNVTAFDRFRIPNACFCQYGSRTYTN